MTLHAPIPVLRIFSEAKAGEFHLDFAGFTLRWEHRFEPGLPVYAYACPGIETPRRNQADQEKPPTLLETMGGADTFTESLFTIRKLANEAPAKLD